VKILTGIVSKENLWYQCLEDEPKTLDTILFQNLDRILSEYKSNVDQKRETMRSIQRLQKEMQQLEEQVQKTLQSDLTKSLLYPPRISTT
jgi:gas vesicle protein